MLKNNSAVGMCPSGRASVFEPAGKTQAVHESEHQGHDPRRTGRDANIALPATQNFCRDKYDAQRDHCLDRPLRNVHVAKRRQSQRDAVRDGESGDGLRPVSTRRA